MVISAVWYNKYYEGMININNNICYIIAACKENFGTVSISPRENDFIIAADGGYDLLKEINVNADILLGDFDSIKELPKHNYIVKYPAQKDDTDTFLAYKLGMEKGYRNFVILGGIGGRIDHTVANIRTLFDIAENGGRGFLIGDGSVLTSISNTKITFPASYSGYISIFANGKDAGGVSIKGLKYSADNISLKPSISLGVSNEFVGERAEISVKDGNLLIIWHENASDFLENIDNFLYIKTL